MVLTYNFVKILDPRIPTLCRSDYAYWWSCIGKGLPLAAYDLLSNFSHINWWADDYLTHWG